MNHKYEIKPEALLIEENYMIDINLFLNNVSFY